jgi:hypothetical protein
VARGFWRSVIAAIVIVGLLVSCRPATMVDTTPTAGHTPEAQTPEVETPFVSPLSTTTFQSPVKPVEGGRSFTAFDSYEVARQVAQEWNSQAVWFGIMPSTIMEGNLGIPSVGRGWFFRFGLKENTLEYYVFVDNNKVGGRTEAQPILLEPLPYEFLPIDIKQLAVDSSRLLDIYVQNGGEAYFEQHSNAKLDYRLLHVKGVPNPVWSLFDATDMNHALIHVDAKTAKIVSDPFAATGG